MRERLRKRPLRHFLLAGITACLFLTAFGEISDQVDRSFQEARGLAAEGKLDSAIGVLERAVLLEPRSPGPNHFLARLLIEAERLDQADSTLARLLEIRPDDGESLYLKGLIALARQDSTAAVELFERALTDPRAGRRR